MRWDPRKRIATLECIKPIMIKAHEKVHSNCTKCEALMGRHRKARELNSSKQQKSTAEQTQPHAPIHQAEFTFTCLLDGLCMEASDLRLTEKEQATSFLQFLDGTDLKDGVSASEPMEGVVMTSSPPEPEDIGWLNQISDDLDELLPQPKLELERKPLTEFLIFGRLPIELRLKIFEHALPENYKDHRILTITGIIPTAKSLIIEPSKLVSLSQTHHETTLSTVNHESRDVWLHAYHSKITLRGHSILRFSPKTTIFYLPNFTLTSEQFHAFSQSEYWPRQLNWMSTVQILAVDTFDNVVSLATSTSTLKPPTFLNFPNVKKLVLLIDAGRLVSRTYQGCLGVRKMLEEQKNAVAKTNNIYWKKLSRKGRLEMQMKSLLGAVRNTMVDAVRIRVGGPVGEEGSRERNAWERSLMDRVPSVVMMDLMMHGFIPGAGGIIQDL